MTDSPEKPRVNTISSMMDQNGRLIYAQAGMLEEIVRLRAELAEKDQLLILMRDEQAECFKSIDGYLRRADRAEAACARVRELCDDLHPFCKGGHVLDAVRDAATTERTYSD